jgi:hypothetical protein
MFFFYLSIATTKLVHVVANHVKLGFKRAKVHCPLPLMRSFDMWRTLLQSWTSSLFQNSSPFTPFLTPSLPSWLWLIYTKRIHRVSKSLKNIEKKQPPPPHSTIYFPAWVGSHKAVGYGKDPLLRVCTVSIANALRKLVFLLLSIMVPKVP